MILSLCKDDTNRLYGLAHAHFIRQDAATATKDTRWGLDGGCARVGVQVERGAILTAMALPQRVAAQLLRRHSGTGGGVTPCRSVGSSLVLVIPLMCWHWQCPAAHPHPRLPLLMKLPIDSHDSASKLGPALGTVEA